MKVFDAHLHWRNPDENPYELCADGVASDGTRKWRRFDVYLPEAYFADAGDIEIVGAIHVEAEWNKSDPVGETRWLDEIHAEGATRGLTLGVVGFADLSQPDVEPILEAQASFRRLKGVRQMLNHLPGVPAYCWADREYLDDPVWRDNFRLLGKYGLDFDLMCFAHQMPAIARLATATPEVRIHLEHTGMPWDHTPDGRRHWRDGLRLIADLENADLKISGLGNTIPDWTEDKIRPYVLEAIDIFGPDRVCLASNFPTDKAFSDMAAIWSAFDRILSGFSPQEREAMFLTNAPRFYGLS